MPIAVDIEARGLCLEHRHLRDDHLAEDVARTSERVRGVHKEAA